MPGHHGGGGFHGGGFGRRGFGGGWGGWGWPYDYGYGYAPCYAYDAYGNCLPYPGVPVMDPHALVQGFHRGHLYEPSAPLVTAARIMDAPSNVPSRIEMTLHGHELTVAIQIDQKTYQGTVDLSEIFDVARHYLRAYHEQLHNEPHLLLAGSVPDAEQVGCVVAQDTVNCGVDMLVGKLVAEHRAPYDALLAGWWGDLTRSVKHAFKDVEHAVSDVANDVGQAATAVLKTVGPAIATAAGVAAGAIIPGAGPLASSLAGSLVNAVTGTGSAKQAAQQVVQQAQQMATSNPQVAQALGTAQQAVAQATSGAQTAQTFAAAAAGNPAAMGQVQQLAQAAQGGDTSAQAVLNTAQSFAGDASGAATASTDTTAQPADLAAADATATSGAVDSPRELASKAAAEHPARVVGVVLTSQGHWQVQPFPDSDHADDWFGGWAQQPEAFIYVAYFDKGDPTFPHPLNEQTGKHAVAVSGALAGIALLAAGVAAGLYGPAAYERGRQWINQKLHPDEPAGGPGSAALAETSPSPHA